MEQEMLEVNENEKRSRLRNVFLLSLLTRAKTKCDIGEISHWFILEMCRNSDW